MPTASAVVADMIDTAVGRTAITFKTLELWAEDNKRVDFASPGDLQGRFYFRFDVVDQPGVMGQITGRLGQHGISIASVFQHEPSDNNQQTVPIIIMTHHAPESAAQAAMQQILDMPTVADTAEKTVATLARAWTDAPFLHVLASVATLKSGFATASRLRISIQARSASESMSVAGSLACNWCLYFALFKSFEQIHLSDISPIVLPPLR